MADKLMHIPNDKQNYPFFRLQLVQWLKRLDNQLTGPTNQNSMKLPKFLKPTNKKTIS